MKATLLEGSAHKLSLLLRSAGLKGRQVVDAIRVATEETITVLRTEINKGNYQEVVSMLAAKALLIGKSALLEKITSRVASRLMLRLGLPGIIAAGVVAVLVPFVLMKLRKRAMAKNDAGELLETLEVEENRELQGKVQLLLTENAHHDAPEQPPGEPESEQVPEEPIR